MKKLNIFLLTFLLLPNFSWAEIVDSCGTEYQCIEVGRWDIGLAVGYGSRSNPLKDYDDIPIYIAPTFAYYGDSWYFDNGNIGYTLAEGERYTLNLTTSFSTESAFFHRWDPSNIFITGSSKFEASALSSRSQPTIMAEEQSVPMPNDLENRDFTYLGGIEAYLYTKIGIINLELTHDLLNVHQGTEAKLQWLYNLAVKQWNFELALEFDWKSEEVVNYYYGIRPSESEFWSQAYKAESAINTSLKFTSHYVLNEHWKLLFLARYTQIADEIVASPLLDEDYTSTFFLGTAYRF
ncbi:MipA/OmpV family protein [Shewanella eurypsychrophilus]|uniref:MipA/OmpV family protein n=1 Tax=Shewanella eurypsychrophilus TaxID=2593656 RepID=A0ABX6V2J2_9GAMM|nr:MULTISPECIES: MipA/OmpV family protein [Shewanella]QFU21557.1 MipA/OmpV family protein [Shewanella sp. YLB-09]QPG56847.1 MipA/OmpV family protein [Shewanella eurypsychrophilus]